MELYTTSSYNETLSGGETLSSISEKSCISASNPAKIVNCSEGTLSRKQQQELRKMAGREMLLTTGTVSQDFDQHYLVK